MKVAILFQESIDALADRTDPQKADAYWGGWMAYIKALEASGLVVSGAGLQAPETAAVVRMKNGVRDVQDGPFADSKEQLGGLFVLEVDDMETALEWAARSPAAASGCVEVRPCLAPPAEG